MMPVFHSWTTGADSVTSTKPKVRATTPPHAVPGGRLFLHGEGFDPARASEHRVFFGDRRAPLCRVSREILSVVVPEGAMPEVRVEVGAESSDPLRVSIAAKLAEDVQPVTNPVFDPEGRLYVTLSGRRGEKVPVSVFVIEEDGEPRPYASDIVNATGLAWGPDGRLYVSSRHEGAVYRVDSSQAVELVVDELGIATGVAFDREGILYVGDRRGTIFRIERNGEPRSLCHLEPSVAAYHLAFDEQGTLFVAAPSLATVDRIYRVGPDGVVSIFAEGFGRPQGMAFDGDGNLYVTEGLTGASGVYRLTPDGETECVVSGPPLVGIAFDRDGSAVLAGANELFRLELGIDAQPRF